MNPQFKAEMIQHPELEASSELGKAALTTFFRIAELWDLSEDEQIKLLGIDKHKFKQYTGNHDHELSEATLFRISCILGIYKDLQILLPCNETADSWVKKINAGPFFGGKSALDIMQNDNPYYLIKLREYLDAQCYSGL